MQLSAFAVAGLVALVKADPCMVQLGRSDVPCVYSTSDCLSGTIQWNYPTNSCQWTFSPQGASALELSASWATAEYSNVTFYDGIGPDANVIGFVEGKSDQAGVNLTSSTGMIHVKLRGPPTMMTYALIFDYKLTPKEKCSIYSDDCQKCLNAGCFMMDNFCTPLCPSDAPCWGRTQNTEIAATCAARKQSMDKDALCQSKSDCESCHDVGCKWNVKGDSCIASCGFFPCELATTCEWWMRVKGQASEGRRGDPIALSNILQRLRWQFPWD